MEEQVRALVQAIVQQSPTDLLNLASALPWKKCASGCALCSARIYSSADYTTFMKKYFLTLFERILAGIGTNALLFYKLHGKEQTGRLLQLFLLHSDATSCFQVLMSVIKMRKAKDVHFIVEQLAAFLKANRLIELLLDSTEDAADSKLSCKAKEQSTIADEELARSIVNLPDLVANYAAAPDDVQVHGSQSQSKPPVFDNLDDDSVSLLTRAGYFDALYNALLHTLRTASDLLRDERAVDSRFLARLIGTLCLHAEQRTRVWTSCLLQLAGTQSDVENDILPRSLVRKLVDNLPSSSARDCLSGLFDAAASHCELAFVLGHFHARDTKVDPRRIELLEFAFKRQFCSTLRKSVSKLRNVLVLFAVDLERVAFVRTVFDEMLSRFADRATLQFLDRAEMHYLCATLLLTYGLLVRCVQHNDSVTLLDVTGLQHAAMNRLMFGVQTNLQSTRTDLKALALCATELIVNHANGHDGDETKRGETAAAGISKLDFELTQTNDVRQLRTLFRDVLQARFLTPVEPQKSSQSKGPPSADTNAQKQLHTSSTTNANEKTAVPNAKHIQAAANWLSNKKSAHAAVKTKQPSSVDSDDDDDRYLQFDTSHDKPLPSGTAPKYIRELLESLLLNDANASNADARAIANFEASLRAAASLIRTHPRSSREACLDLTDALLDLHDTFSTPQFDDDRLRALVEVCAVAPERVTERLVERFFERDNSVRRRLDVLETLKRTALRLARLDEAGVPLPDAAQQPEQTTERSTSIDWRKIIDERVAAKTRITKPESLKKQHAESMNASHTSNEFAKVAGYFYFPLLRDFDRRIGAFDLLDEDNACQLLATYFQTVAILHYCCSCSLPATVAQRVARVFFDVLFVVRFHRDQDVRRNVHAALFTLLSLLPASMLVQDFAAELAELRSWLTEVFANDCNDDVRKLAQQSIILVGTKLQEELEGSSQEH